MKLASTTTRRVVAVAGAAIAGLAISTAAYAATSSPTAARTPAAAVPRCTATDLGVWVAVDQGSGAAGTIAYPLEFTNLSHHTCYLYGYPGVSALGSNGNQLGHAADWGSLAGARVVNLAPGATAHTLLGYHEVAVTTDPGCAPVKQATDLLVYPPGQRSATDAAFVVPGCSNRATVYMSILEPIIPGVGTIYG